MCSSSIMPVNYSTPGNFYLYALTAIGVSKHSNSLCFTFYYCMGPSLMNGPYLWRWMVSLFYSLFHDDKIMIDEERSCSIVHWHRKLPREAFGMFNHNLKINTLLTSKGPTQYLITVTTHEIGHSFPMWEQTLFGISWLVYKQNADQPTHPTGPVTGLPDPIITFACSILECVWLGSQAVWNANRKLIKRVPQSIRTHKLHR